MRLKQLILVLVSLFLLSACNAQEKRREANENSAKFVNVTEAYALLHADTSIVVLDVRTPQEYNAGHIPNALNKNVIDANFVKNIQPLDKSKTYLLHCRTQNRSRKALAFMQQQGFKHLYLMTGGFKAWQQEGFAIGK